MVKKIVCSILCAFILTGVSSFAQENKEFKITGSPIITVFSDFHSGLGKHNKISGFELTRAYLGYQFNLNEKLSGRVIIDAGAASSDRFLERQGRDIHLKNALLNWKEDRVTISAGLVGTKQFDIQNKHWGHRYISRSFQDLYKFGPSADLGVIVSYAYSSWLNADFSLTNGEGYKNLNADNKYSSGAGITVMPVKGLTLRVYGDIDFGHPEMIGYETDRQTYALFAGYKNNLFSIGAEYNYQLNNGFIKGNDYFGYSIYSQVSISPKYHIFARYDRIDSENKQGNAWYDGGKDFIVAGLEYTPIKQLKIAPNYQYNVNETLKGPMHEIYLSAEFNW